MDIKILVASRLNDHLDELNSFIDGLTEEQLSERQRDGGASLADIALHLFDVQDAYVEMTARMLVEENPVLNGILLDHDVLLHNGREDLRRRTRDFAEQRKNLVSLLNALTDQQWKREGVHPFVRHFTVEKCMEGLMRHEEYHMYEMYRIFFDVRDSA